MIYILPHGPGLNSVAQLRERLPESRVLRSENSRFVGAPHKIVINWGKSVVPENVADSTILNTPEAVAIASNKLSFFEAARETVSIPEFTTEQSVAESWLESGTRVVVREKLNASRGDGIVLIEDMNTWETYNHRRAKLYVKYIPKRDEYRIHVMNGEVIDMQRKAINSRYRAEDVNHQIRNHNNGYVFIREGVNPPQTVKDECVAAVAACGLDFGAVDVVFNVRRDKAYVLEINTAPGLEGSTIDSYIEGLTNLVEETRQGRRRFEPSGRYAPASDEPFGNVISDEAESIAEQIRERQVEIRHQTAPIRSNIDALDDDLARWTVSGSGGL